MLLLAFSPLTPTYSEGVVGQPISFLPSKAQSQSDITISSLIYRGLFKYDIYGTLLPDLADTWEISQDGLVYTIKLKSDQYWSNGKRITADDLIYTSFKVTDLSGVATDRVDDTTVRYTLPNKYSPFLSLLTVGVMPANSEETQDQLTPTSSGPFNIVGIEKSGPVVKSIVLLHQSKEAHIKKIIFRYYANEDEVKTAAQLGEIDGFIATKDHDLQNFNQLKFPLQGVYYALFFNLRDETAQDADLRKALAAVLPVDQIIYSKGISVQGPISRNVFTDRDINFNYFDAKFVKDLSKEVIELTVPDIKQHKEMANEIENIWEDKLGIDVQIREVDADKVSEEVIMPRNFEILLYGQEIGRDPDRYVHWHSTQKDFPGLNLSGMSQVRADRALEEGRNEPENEKRIVHYNEFQKVVHEEIPAIFLYHPYSKYYVSKYISGVGEKYTFTNTDRFLDFLNWQRVKTN